MAKQFSFRIKKGSKLDDLLRKVTNGEVPKITKSALNEEGFHWHEVDTMFILGRDADNLTVSRDRVTYQDVVPTTIVTKTDTVNAQAVVSPSQSSDEYSGPQFYWPEAPRIRSVDEYPWFRKPKFYEMMKSMVGLGKHISLEGPPGIGKSSAVEYLAAEQGQILVDINGDAGLRRRDLTGSVELVNSHTQFNVALYLAAVKFGWWVKMDEINSAEPDALMYLNSQIAPPYSASFYGTNQEVHPNFRLFATYNAGLVGTKPLPESLKDRFFPIKLEFPTEAMLRKMLVANGMPSNDILVDWTNFVVTFGAKAWELHKMGRMRYQITPRRLMDAVTLVTELGLEVDEAIEAAVINAVDNKAEVNVLKQLLNQMKSEFTFGRN